MGRIQLRMAIRRKQKLRRQIARIQRLHNQHQLLLIAQASSVEAVQLAVVEKLWDQQALLELAGQRSSNVRREVVMKLKDRKILTRMAALDPDGAVRRTADRVLQCPIDDQQNRRR